MGKEKKGKIRTFIGGQALLEGVMMRGKTSMAMAVRNSDGDILLETERIKPRKKLLRLPVLRGVAAFGSSLVTGIKTLTRSAEAVGGEDEKLGKGAMAFAVIMGVALALVFFFFIPGVLAGLFNDHVYDNVLVKNLVSGALRISIFVIYLALVSLMKDIRRTFMYHGAEHRTINCFEKGLPLTVENVQSCSTRHNRCGTTFMFLVMLISILVFVFVDYGLTKLLPMDKGFVRNLAYMGIKLVFLPLVAGISYEILFLFAKLPDNWFSLILRAPGLALQRLTTKKPDDAMAEVAIASFNAVLLLENDKSAKTQRFGEISVTLARKEIAEVLSSLDAEPVEAEWMLCAVTGKKRGELAGLSILNTAQYSALKKLLEKRKTMPLDYCLGTACFFGRDVAVDKRVLIPRMETEVLAEAAIRLIGEGEADVLDLCTGSGCIALTLAKETSANVVAADISVDALKVAAQNLEGAGVEVVVSDLFSALEGRRFDVIVSNPPYIKSGDIPHLQEEVKCQPHLALDGGEDGLDFYRRIASESAIYLKPQGYLLLEVGFDQAETVARLLRSGGFTQTDVIKDLEGIERVVVARL